MSAKTCILITGSNGLLGQKLVYALKNDPEVQLVATSRGPNRLAVQEGYTYCSLDITNRQQVVEVLEKYKPDVVMHTAAMTNVDQCETEREACRMQNVEAVRHLVEAIDGMHQKRVHLIHLSTDFIFDGEAGPYREEDAPNPVSFYGWSKYDAERIITASGIDWAILRTIIVYGITDNMSRSNIVLWAREALRKGQPMNVVNDQFRSPTLAEDLAQGCILAAKQRARGIFHISGPDTLSIIDLVGAVARVNGLSMDCVEAVSSATLNQPAKRPPRTGFIIDKARRVLGYAPHTFEAGIRLVQEQADAFERANPKP